jgi:hypothetical protein
MAIKHSESEQSVLEDMQHIACKRKEMEAVNSEESNQDCMPAEELTDSTKTAEVLEKGFMQYG